MSTAQPTPESKDTIANTGSRGTKIASAIGTFIPTVLAFAAIGGIAFWGHRTGWSAPKFSQLTGTKAVAEEDWCTEHGVPDSRCIKCHPELVGANMNDWCPEHGLPESKCTICHPELLTTGVAGDWCPEHAVPESSCTLCHPEIAVRGNLPRSETSATVTLVSTGGQPLASATPAGTAGGAARSTPPSTAPTSTPAELLQPSQRSQKDPRTCQTHNMRVQFASGDAVRKAGVELGQVVERAMSASLTANAEVNYNNTRLAQISSAVAGKVWRVEKEVGQLVRQGEVIALVDSVEVGRAKAEYLQAAAALDLKSKTLNRLRQSSESGLRTIAELQEADAAVTDADIRVFNARQALINLGLAIDPKETPTQENVKFLGLPKELAQRLDPNTTSANLVPLTAPFDGTVIERHAVAGEVVDPSKALFVIADTTKMWVTADISLADARRIALGQPVTFRADGARDESASGVITWISTAVDDQTRTVKVRADIDNADGRMLAHTFGKAAITIRQTPTAIAVPSEAIQWEGCCNVAFVRLTDDIFQTRKVKLGATVNGYTEVLIGLLPGEVVATSGSHVLKSEILKSALGAGCTDGH